MTVVKGILLRDGGVELTTTAGDRLRSLKELSEYLSTHGTLSAPDYRFLGATAILMTAAQQGSALDRVGLLKSEDVEYMTLPSDEAAAAFSDGENDASTRLANVDPQSRAFEAYVLGLNEAIQQAQRERGSSRGTPH